MLGSRNAAVSEGTEHGSGEVQSRGFFTLLTKGLFCAFAGFGYFMYRSVSPLPQSHTLLTQSVFRVFATQFEITFNNILLYNILPRFDISVSSSNAAWSRPRAYELPFMKEHCRTLELLHTYFLSHRWYPHAATTTSSQAQQILAATINSQAPFVHVSVRE